MSFPKDIVNIILYRYHLSLVQKCIIEYFNNLGDNEGDNKTFPIRIGSIDEAYQYRIWGNGRWSNNSIYTNLKNGDIIPCCNLPKNY